MARIHFEAQRPNGHGVPIAHYRLVERDWSFREGILLSSTRRRSPLSEWIIARAYPVGLVRHILRATKNRLGSNFPPRQSRQSHASTSRQPRACGHSAFPPDNRVIGAHNSAPKMTHRVSGEERLSAALAGIAARAISSYLVGISSLGGISCSAAMLPHG